MAKKRAKKTTKNGNEGIASLMDELFQAAVALRGPIETPDYKCYVLPLIFLRFLSLRYEHRRAELEALVDDPKSDWYADDPETRKAILEDSDAYAAAGAFIVPKAARWSELVAQAQADDIKLKVDGALELLEQTYPEQLRGLLPKVFARSNMAAEDLGQLIALFSKDMFRENHGGEDLIGRVYEYFIGEFASAEGKRGVKAEDLEAFASAVMEQAEASFRDWPMAA